ncbi:prothoracicostatic peptide isoform X1 [Tribolium madens]|uniref:prothoracicostatic peptide isoform X1 n=2 Tax=Tribolium madens TaxID=41895 RepID=UPI001CF71DA7|nr:prothoracicostatic peptide isoform X1 [Tribolium madens]
MMSFAAAIMRDAVAPMLGAVLLTCYSLHAALALSDETPLKSSNDNPQIEDEMSKRDWNKDLHIWGKRGWNNLHEGWGRKRSVPAWEEQQEKRAWQSLQSGWGKRFAPEDEYAIRQLAAMLDSQYDDYNPEIETNDDEKRNWGQFHGGWGKRSKWDNFRGSWGKREPAWSNLKGIWGKRSGEK